MLRVGNWVCNQRLPDDESSSLARKNASEMVLIPKGGGADARSKSISQPRLLATRTVGEALHALPRGSTHQAPWVLSDGHRGHATPPPREDHLASCHRTKEPTPLTGQGQGVVPPAGRRHDGLVAETLDEPGGFHSLGVAMSQLPLLVSACGSRAG